MSALREIIAKFGVSFDTGELKKGIASVDGAVKSLKGFAGALGIGLSIGALKDFVLATNDQIIALDKQSRFLRVGMEDLQRWQQAAQIAGVSTEALNGLFETMRMRTRKPTEGILQLSDKLAAIKDPTQRARMGTMMLGNSYRELEPLLEKGRKGIKGLIGESEDLAAVLGHDQVKAAKENRANLARLNIMWGGMSTQIGSMLLPVLTELLHLLVPVVRVFKEITSHAGLFQGAILLLATAGVWKLIAPLRAIKFSLVDAFSPLASIGRGARTAFGALFSPLKTGRAILEAATNGARKLASALSFKGIRAGIKNIGGIRGAVTKLGTTLKSTLRATNQFGEKFARSIKTGLAILGPFFADDLATFLKGGNSLIGKFLDGAFGPGSSEKVRNFINTLLGDWDSFEAYFKAVWDYAGDIMQVFINETVGGMMWLGAKCHDIFSEMWNGIVDGAKWTVRLLAAGAKTLGMNDTARDLNDYAGSLDGSKGTTNNADEQEKFNQQMREQIGKQLLDAGDKVSRMSAQLAAGKKLGVEDRPTAGVPGKAGAGAQGTTTVQNNVNVHLPPGTTEQTANRVATATSKAMQKNNAATYAAAVPGRG